MFNAIFYTAVAVIAVVFLIAITYGLGVRYGIFPDPRYFPEDVIPEDGYDDDDDDEYDEEYEESLPPLPAIVPAIAWKLSPPEVDTEADTVTRLAAMDHIGIRDFKRMKLRAESPHLYADDWFAVSKEEYSLHAVRHAEERRQFRMEMGLRAA